MVVGAGADAVELEVDPDAVECFAELEHAAANASIAIAQPRVSARVMRGILAVARALGE